MATKSKALKSKSIRRAKPADPAAAVIAALQRVGERLEPVVTRAEKAAEKAAEKPRVPNVWERLDDLHTRLYTLYMAAYYIGDYAPDGASSPFFMLGNSIEREHEEVGELLEQRADFPQRSAS